MIITCSECKKEVSDKAKSCPHCGAPINSTVKQISNTVRSIASSKTTQRAIHGSIIPGLITVLAPITLICVGLAILAFIVVISTGAEDQEAIGALILFGPLSIVLIVILNLIDRRKPNPHMRGKDYLDAALSQIQRKQSHFPKRKRSHNTVRIPNHEITTSENMIRTMTDEIIIKNALLEWTGAPSDIPHLGDSFIYERDVSPYVEYLMAFKTSEEGASLSDRDEILKLLRCHLNPLRDYEAIQNEISDGVLKDTGEYNRRIAGILSPDNTANNVVEDKPTFQTISDYIPDGYKAVETRPYEECKQVSAYVVFDKIYDAAILYLDMELAWLEQFRPQNLGLQTIFDEDGLKANSQIDSPQMITMGTTLYLNRYTSMRFILVCKDKQPAHITIPWPPMMFDQFTRKRPLLFIGMNDGKAYLNGDVSTSVRNALFQQYVRNVFK